MMLKKSPVGVPPLVQCPHAFQIFYLNKPQLKNLQYIINSSEKLSRHTQFGSRYQECQNKLIAVGVGLDLFVTSQKKGRQKKL